MIKLITRMVSSWIFHTRQVASWTFQTRRSSTNWVFKTRVYPNPLTEGVWILEDGTWNDDGIWLDGAIWKDS